MTFPPWSSHPARRRIDRLFQNARPKDEQAGYPHFLYFHSLHCSSWSGPELFPTYLCPQPLKIPFLPMQLFALQVSKIVCNSRKWNTNSTSCTMIELYMLATRTLERRSCFLFCFDMTTSFPRRRMESSSHLLR